MLVFFTSSQLGLEVMIYNPNTHWEILDPRQHLTSAAYAMRAEVGGGSHSNPAYGNEAFSNYSAILGGGANIAGDNSLQHIHTVGIRAAISGGASNIASGNASSVGGDTFNTASGNWSTVSGGTNRSVSGASDWRASSLFEENSDLCMAKQINLVGLV